MINFQTQCDKVCLFTFIFTPRFLYRRKKHAISRATDNGKAHAITSLPLNIVI